MVQTWRTFVSPKGSRVFFRVVGHALENVIYGNMDVGIAIRLQSEFDVVERVHGKFVGFHYWHHAPTYDTAYRASWMAWLEQKKGTLKETHFLTKSRIVRMGLAVANIAYSHTTFVVHAEEPSYVEQRRRFMPDAPIPSASKV